MMESASSMAIGRTSAMALGDRLLVLVGSWKFRASGEGGLLDLCGAEFDLGVGHFEGKLVHARFDGIPAGKKRQ